MKESPKIENKNIKIKTHEPIARRTPWEKPQIKEFSAHLTAAVGGVGDDGGIPPTSGYLS